jgi:AAA+ ATPase superfamily predicted ATPase
MPDYIGRDQERVEFAQILRRKEASLVTCQGRRRIGKSRFIMECAQTADHRLEFSGLAPREGLTRADELEAFATQLAAQTRAPKLPLPDWPTAFQLLASQLPASGSVVVLLDEISWMAIGDADFAGHLKTAWDQHFSKRNGLVLVLCGSVSSWIEQNILNNTGFVGRCSWHFRLGPLPLSDCAKFWGRRKVSDAEKLTFLSVTGGVPGYLREMDPARSAEWNIARLCFHPGGMIFHEFERIFHDIFSRRAETYRAIVQTLVAGPRTPDQISAALGRARGGSLSEALTDLEQAGFLRRDAMIEPATGKARPRDARYRICDNHLRFHLKYIAPVRDRVLSKHFKLTSVESLDHWDTIAGLQFETLILSSLDAVYAAAGLERSKVLSAGPYFQKQTQRRQGCQIDLLIRTRRCVHVFEMKFRRRIGQEVTAEVREKAARLKLPPGISLRTGLIYCGELDPGINEGDEFDTLISAGELLNA